MRTRCFPQEGENSTPYDAPIVKGDDSSTLHDVSTEASIPQRRVIGVLAVNEAEVWTSKSAGCDIFGARLNCLQLG